MRVVLRLIAAAGLLILIATALITVLYAWPRHSRSTEAWVVGPALPGARGELATAVVHGAPCAVPPCPQAERLHVLGGLSGLYRPRRRVSVYDPNSGLWSTGPPLPEPRHHFAAASLAGALYVSGGTSAAGLHLSMDWPPHDNLWRLAAGADRWDSVGPMPEPRWGHRMVAHDGRLYVVGGRGPSARVLIYAPEAGWSAGAPLPRQRDHLSVVVAKDRIWAIGGRDPSSLARVDIYDPPLDRWQPGPDLPAPTSGAAEGVIDGIIVIYGGEEPSLFGGVNDRHWMLDTRPATPRWEPAPAPPLAVHGADGAVLQGALVIAGGSTRHGILTFTGWSNTLQIMKHGAVAR